MILGRVRRQGRLRYVGEVGSGLTDRTIRQLKSELDAHRLDTPPVVNPPRIKGAVWSEPRLVVRVEFTEWTTDGYLRQAAYKGMDIGKDPRTVVRERELPAEQTAAKAEKEAKQAARTVDTPASLPLTARRARAKAPAKRAPSRAAQRAKPSKADQLFFEDPDDREDPPQAATPGRDGRAGGDDKGRRLGDRRPRVSLTNLDKVLFPDPGFTKRDLIRYYVTIAPVMLPYLRDRPSTCRAGRTASRAGTSGRSRFPA